MRLGIAIIVVVCLLVAGCGGKNPLVGKWTDTKMGIMTFEFTADGKMSMGAMGTTQSGIYKVEGNKLTMTQGTKGGASVTQPFSISGDTLTIGEGQGALTLKRAK